MVTATAVIVRVLWVVPLARVPKGLSDPILYHIAALQIAEGDGYRSIAGFPTAYYPPGYPWFLGSLYWVVDLFGFDSQRAVIVGLVQCLLWGFSTLCVVLAARMMFGHRTGTIAGLILALWPNLIFYSSAVLSESLFVAFFSGFLLAVTWLTLNQDRALTDRSMLAGFAAAAMALGAATMVRPQVLLSVPAVLIAWLIGSISWKRGLVLTAALTVGVLLFVIPWAARNKSVFDHWIPVSTNGGDNLCVGFHPGAPGGFSIPEYCETGEFYIEGPEAEYSRDVETRELAIEAIRDDPGALPLLSLRKIQFTFSSDIDGLRGAESYVDDLLLDSTQRRVITDAAGVFYWSVLGASIVGLVMLIGRAVRHGLEDQVWVLIALVFSGLLVPVLVFGDARFKIPMTPLMAILAAFTVDFLWRRIRGQQNL